MDIGQCTNCCLMFNLVIILIMSEEKPISLGSLLSSGKLTSSGSEDIEFDVSSIQSPKPAVEPKNKSIKSKSIVTQKEIKKTKK